MAITYNLSELKERLDRFEGDLNAYLDQKGREAVELAKQTGSYQNRTGRLRASNGYKVENGVLSIFNEAYYAPFVEAKGFTVITEATLIIYNRILNDNK